MDRLAPNECNRVLERLSAVRRRARGLVVVRDELRCVPDIGALGVLRCSKLGRSGPESCGAAPALKDDVLCSPPFELAPVVAARCKLSSETPRRILFVLEKYVWSTSELLLIGVPIAVSKVSAPESAFDDVVPGLAGDREPSRCGV